jgi:hypothetical protein
MKGIGFESYRRGRNFGRLLGAASLAVLATATLAAPAHAQQEPQEEAEQTGVGSTAEQAASAATEAATGEEIVVTGFRRSLAEALNIKRDSVSAVDAIVAEDIAKFPDQNLAESLQRIPGISIIRAGMDIKTHDVIVRHIRIHTGVDGQPQRSGWEADAISTIGARNVIVDHCSLIWAIDENLSASGPRFTGNSVEEWRRGTSHNITFSYNLLAEGLRYASHPKGEHSKGSLIHDNVTGMLIYRNLYAHNQERNPLLKGGVHAAVVNNFIYNPGLRAVHYNLMALEWGDQPYQLGELSAVGNVLRGGPDTSSDMTFLAIGGAGDLRYHGRDNIAVDFSGKPLPMLGRYTTAPARIIEVERPRVWPEGLEVLPAREVEKHVLAWAGARPWDRDAHDIRITFDVAEGRGEIIDDEKEVGGYLKVEPTRAPFVEAEWDLDTMEPKSGRYPGQKDGYVQQPTTARDREMRR